MDILIKNMEMPEGCFCCPLSDKHSRFDGNEWHSGCFVLCKEVSDDGEKDEDCPLIQVSEHGDLIDRDAVLTELKKYYKVGEIAEVGEVACFIDEAEVVLEAST